MNFKILYNVGSIILFLGLFWSFLPHAFHNAISHGTETEHYIHLIEGTIGILIGLIIMIWSNQQQRKAR